MEIIQFLSKYHGKVISQRALHRRLGKYGLSPCFQSLALSSDTMGSFPCNHFSGSPEGLLIIITGLFTVRLCIGNLPLLIDWQIII